MIDQIFWRGKNVFLTGHTGFKGGWLSLWLQKMGAHVTGYALHPPTSPNLFTICRCDGKMHSIQGDIRNMKKLAECLQKARPEIIIHMAAQSLVSESYREPLQTYETNVMGTVHLLEAVRQTDSVQAVINVTTDKCYENKEWVWGYRENEPMGGYDPYSSSKGCSELVTSAYRRSFFQVDDKRRRVAIASARAGNVIGGGDWADNRLLPDCMRAIERGERIIIRSPKSVRPWQHVLEPLSGYLLLAQRLCEMGQDYAEAWNFGPEETDARDVEWIVNRLCTLWDHHPGYAVERRPQLHEANILKLDCSKAKVKLGWYPRWNLEQALEKIHEWMVAYEQKADMREFCGRQIDEYMKTIAGADR